MTGVTRWIAWLERPCREYAGYCGMAVCETRCPIHTHVSCGQSIAWNAAAFAEAPRDQTGC